jgi:Tol biopolymer transport system component
MDRLAGGTSSRPGRRWTRSLPGLVALLGFAALVAIPGHRDPAGCHVSSKAIGIASAQIAFTCYSQSVGGMRNGDVFVAGPRDGTEALTRGWAFDGDPAWSSDGSRVAFDSTRDGNLEIYGMGADGTNPTRLTRDPGWDFTPDWSPDGARIAFVSTRGTREHIYVMNADGSGVTALTPGPWRDYDPDWSPDGSRIAFTSNRSGHWGVYVMRADGSGPAPITRGPGDASQPSWSSDGTRIAFTHIRQDGTGSVYTMNSDGSEQKELVRGDGFLPTWSPNGRAIAFESSRGGSAQIWIALVAGGPAVQLTDGRGEAFVAAWRPSPSDGTAG